MVRKGENPPSPLPGEIPVDNVLNPNGFLKRARIFLKGRPHIIEGARQDSQEIVAAHTSLGTVLYIGVGLAAVALSLGWVIVFPEQDGTKPKE